MKSFLFEESRNNLEEIVLQYQQGIVDKKRLLEQLSPLIYNMPARMKQFDPDLTHSFYIYAISKVEKAIRRYNHQHNCSFRSWFFLKLQRDFFQFIKKYKRRLKFDELICDSRDFTYIPAEKREERESMGILKKGVLNKREKRIVKLKYGIDDSGLSEESLDKVRKIKLLEDELSKKYYQLLTIEKEIAATSCPRTKTSLRIRAGEVRRIKRAIEKRYNRYKLWPTDKWVASQLKIKRGTVSSYLHTIRQKIKKELKNCYLKPPGN